MRENIFKNSHIIKKTLFIYKGLLPALCRFLQCFSWIFYNFLECNSTKLDKDNFSTKLGDKISKRQFFCRQEGRSGTRQRQTEFNQGQGQLYNQGFQSQKSVAEKQPPEEAAQQHQPWRWQGREAGSRRTRS